jgi:tetratricopeptide (TPR) repeat protein
MPSSSPFFYTILKENMYRVIKVVFFSASIFMVTRVNAQYTYLNTLTGKERELAIRKICDSIYYAPDTVTAYNIADSFNRYAEEENNDSLALHISLYKIFLYSRRFYKSTDKDRVEKTFNTLLQAAIKKKFITVELDIRDVIANFYWDRLKNYELALQEYNTLSRLVERVTETSYPDKKKIYFHIGYAWFYFKDYAKAIDMFKKAIEIIPKYDFQKYDYQHSIENLGTTYQALNRLDSADHYFQVLHRYVSGNKDSVWIGINNGNIGKNEYLRANYTEAIPLLQFCVDRGIIAGDSSVAAGAQMVLANIYFKQHQIPAAIAATLKARELVRASGHYAHYLHLYPLLAKMYTIQGQATLAGNYVDSGFVVSDSINRMYSGILMARALQKDAIGEQKARLVEAENSKKLMNIKMYAALSIALIILFVTVFIYRNKRKQHRQENELKDIAIKKSLTDLESARVQLKDFTRNIAEKNKLIEEMEKQFGNTNVLAELEKSIILTGSDWRRFKELFEQVHPGYLQRLTEKIPGISPAETRLLTLAKLNFSNKEIASALGITPQAIRVSWHRLRKKINIDDETTTMGELANMV